MSKPAAEQLATLIGAFQKRAVEQGSEARDFPPPAHYSMNEIVELANWRFFDRASRIIFVFDPATGLMRLWATTPEEDALGEGIRRELDTQADFPDSHRFLVLYAQPQPGPNEGQVHHGVSVEETFDRDGGAEYAVAVYDAASRVADVVVAS